MNTFTGTTTHGYDYFKNKFERDSSILSNRFVEVVEQNKKDILSTVIPLDELVLWSSSISYSPTLKLTRFTYEGRTFILDSSVFTFKLQIDSGFHYIDNDYLNLYSYGDSFGEFMNSLWRDIAFLYDEFALIDDNKLAKDAISLKRKLLGSMKVIDNVISK